MTKALRLLLMVAVTFSIHGLYCQEQPLEKEQEDQKVYIVIKNDGTRFVGRIISQDAREVLIKTSDLGEVYIPRHEIREIREISKRELTEEGEYIPGEVFSTRYFFTTNALSIAAKENYVIWSLLGPDIQFGITDNLGMGLMTSWLGWPLIGTIKYSRPIDSQRSVGAGILLGTSTWDGLGIRLALPYGVVTLGNRVANLNFSLGYGVFRYKDTDSQKATGVVEGRALMSVAGMFKAGRSLSIVFDTFIAPTLLSDKKGYAVIMPGIRLQTQADRAFQLGFVGVYYDGEVAPLPIPMIQWFRII